MLAGVSSFGMSGVNAHGIFARSHAASRQTLHSQILWQHRRHWVVPVRYQELQTFQDYQPADGSSRYEFPCCMYTLNPESITTSGLAGWCWKHRTRR